MAHTRAMMSQHDVLAHLTIWIWLYIVRDLKISFTYSLMVSDMYTIYLDPLLLPHDNSCPHLLCHVQETGLHSTSPASPLNTLCLLSEF